MPLWRPPRGHETDQAGDEHDQREWQSQPLQCDEGRDRQDDVQRATERALPMDTSACSTMATTAALQSDQYPARDRQAAEARVGIREAEQQQDGRSDEPEPGDQPAPYAVQLPTEVDGQLQRFGPRAAACRS